MYDQPTMTSGSKMERNSYKKSVVLSYTKMSIHKSTEGQTLGNVNLLPRPY